MIVRFVTMRVLDVEFLRSGADPDAGEGWPEPGLPEVCFVGRSNVGKSSLLEALVGRKGLVRISKTPGRTRLINFFRVALAPEGPGAPDRTELCLVDLPGFGYARVSRGERAHWMPWMERYLGQRSTLRGCVILVDARRGPELDETELGRWLADRGVKVIPVMTKADKLSKHEQKPAADRMRAALGRRPLVVSALKGQGLAELWQQIVDVLPR